MSQNLIEIVEAVKATRRIERPLAAFPHATFFSNKDVWLFDARFDSKTCPLCRLFEDIGIFYGHTIRGIFPHLKILDVNTIGGEASDDTGLVHPNCRCQLHRRLELTK